MHPSNLGCVPVPYSRVFWNTVNMINVKLFVVVVLSEVYPLVPFAVTLVLFQGHSSVSLLNLKVAFLSDFFYLIQWKLCVKVTQWNSLFHDHSKRQSGFKRRVDLGTLGSFTWKCRIRAIDLYTLRFIHMEM